MYIPKAKRDDTVPKNMERLVQGTCPWADNLKKIFVYVAAGHR